MGVKLIQSFADISIQMCQFHQSTIIRRYLTRRAKLIAGQELMTVLNTMKQVDKAIFVSYTYFYVF